MKITFYDGELKRLLAEFATVNYNRISKAKTTKGAIRKQATTVNEYAKRINGWVLTKIDTNYNAKVISKQKY